MDLAKVAVECSTDTFVVKIAPFAKPENVPCNKRNKQNSQPSSVGLHILTDSDTRLTEKSLSFCLPSQNSTIQSGITPYILG